MIDFFPFQLQYREFQKSKPGYWFVFPIPKEKRSTRDVESPEGIWMKEKEHHIDTIVVSVDYKKNPIVIEALSIIDSCEYDFPTEKDVAIKIGVTSEYFSRLFRRIVGKTFKEYLTEMKITRAQELLAYTKLPISMISLEVGYGQQSYFTKVFKRIVGISPLEFRKATLNQKNIYMFSHKNEQ